MKTILDQSLVDELARLMDNEGIRAVSRWTLPNDDIAFDEEDALTDFLEQLDDAFAATSAALDGISATRK